MYPRIALTSLIIFSLCVLASANITDEPTWELCRKTPDLITISNVTITYNDQNLDMIMEASIEQKLDEGSEVTINASCGGIQVFGGNIDMGNGTTLPVQGDFVWKTLITVPSDAPSGDYTLSLRFFDQDYKPLLCMVIYFKN